MDCLENWGTGEKKSQYSFCWKWRGPSPGENCASLSKRPPGLAAALTTPAETGSLVSLRDQERLRLKAPDSAPSMQVSERFVTEVSLGCEMMCQHDYVFLTSVGRTWGSCPRHVRLRAIRLSITNHRSLNRQMDR